MADTTIPVKVAGGDTKSLKAKDDGAAGLSTYHVEDATQRAALVSAVNAITTAVSASGLKLDDQVTLLTSILAAFSNTLTVEVSGSLPLPTGAATNAKLEEVRALLDRTLPVSAESLPLPSGAATETKLEAIRALLAATLAVSVESLPLPTGAANVTKQDAILAAITEGTFPVTVDSIPLPTGAATESKLEEVRTLLAATLAISAVSLPLPDGAATSAKQDTIATKLTALSVKPAGTDRSGSITTGGTAQQLAASNSDRTGLTIQNTSDGDLRITENGTTATASTGYKLTPGMGLQISTNKAVSVYGATTGQTFAATEF